MIVSSLKANVGKCPYWDIDVSVSGIYGEKGKGILDFLRAECPIVENSKLPIYDQDSNYKYMRCKDPHSCPLYTQFQPSITSDR